MQTDAVEAALARLMPPALSQPCQEALDSMIEELSASGPAPRAAPTPSSRPTWHFAAIAAAVALLAGFSIRAIQPVPDLAANSLHSTSSPGWILLGEADRIESVTDEGWQEDDDGSTLHAVRLSVVEENSIKDVETGIVVQVSQPREEILYTPVTAF